MINLITAVSDNNVIGIDNTIPWRLKADMQYFKKVTMGNVVVMGRNTYNSLFSFMRDTNNEPLPGRIKCVVTHDRTCANFKHNVYALQIDNGKNIDAICQWLEKQFGDRQIFIIGGSQIYSLFNGFCENLYITRVHKTVMKIDGSPDRLYEFPITESVLLRDYDLLYSDTKQADENNECDYTFQQWRLKSKI